MKSPYRLWTLAGVTRQQEVADQNAKWHTATSVRRVQRKLASPSQLWSGSAIAVHRRVPGFRDSVLRFQMFFPFHLAAECEVVFNVMILHVLALG